MATTYSIRQLHKGRGILTWYLRTCTDGKETFESLHTTKKGEAKAFLDNLKLKALLPTAPGMADKPIREDADDWIRQCAITFKESVHTMNAYRSRIKTWVDWCDSRKVVKHSEFNAQCAYKFVEHIAEKLSPKTVSEVVKVVKKCLEWNVDTFDLKDMRPFKAVKLPKLKRERVEFWTIEEVESILSKAPNQSYMAFWGLMAYAGLRFSEARTLRKENVRDGLIYVVDGKGGKSAEIPVSSILQELIAPYMDGREGLLIPADKVPTRCDHAIHALKRAVDEAGVKAGSRLHHKLRHSFASELLRNGVNPKTVQELMRHSSIDTLFAHYAHVLRSDLVVAVEKMKKRKP